MDLFIEQIYKLYHKEQIILVDCQLVSMFCKSGKRQSGFFSNIRPFGKNGMQILIEDIVISEKN